MKIELPLMAKGHLCVVTCLLMTSTVVAQQPTEKFADVTRCIGEDCVAPPRIDGVIEDGEWATATLISDMYQVRPDEFGAPSQKTEFFIRYDEDYLYIAAKLYEEDTSNISARTTRQGADITSDDSIRVFIDPYNSKRAGFQFALNPNEVRNEGIFLNITTLSSDWSAIWQGKAQLTDYGWSAEISIPFKTLTFEAGNDTWGLNVYRYISRNNELIGWVSQNRSDNASVSGELRGLTNINQGRGLDIVPSVSASNQRTYGPAGEDDASLEPSLDLFYKITPSLNGALTFNTDFSAAEVDDRQVDLSQFSLFFPEKRAFFLREFDVFDFGGIGGMLSYSRFTGGERQNARPFFSRKIGLSSTGAPVDLIAGAKVSGKIGDYDVGVLAVRQDEFEDVDASSLFVGRVAADVLNESSIGGIFTQGDPRSNLSNSLAGVDFRYRNSQLGAGMRVDANLWYQQTDTEDVSGDDSAYGAMFSMPNSEGWRGIVQYQRVEQNFNPALGFVARRGVELGRANIGHIWQLSDNPYLRLVHAAADAREWFFIDDGRRQSKDWHLRTDLENHTGDKLEFGLLRYGEGVYSESNQPFSNVDILLDLQEYEWDRYGFAFSTSQARQFDLRWSVYDGGYFSGDRLYHFIGFGWRPTNQFRISSSYTYWDVELPEGDFDLKQISTTTEWAFSSYLSWVNVLQYDNISGNLGVNSRLHWTPRAGEDAYFVINHNYNELEEDQFVSTNNEITLKFSYTFRF